MRLTRKHCYHLIRCLAILFGAGLCGVMLTRAWPTLPWADLCLLGVLACALQWRVIVLRRGPDGLPESTHVQGLFLVVIALLRDGPAAALAVSLLGNLVDAGKTAALFRERRGASLWIGLEAILSNAVFLPALDWLMGIVYGHFGGHRLVAPEDVAHFFQNPTFVLLPLVAALLLQTVSSEFLYTGVLQDLWGARSLRDAMADRVLWLAPPLDGFAGAFMLALWTAWGWGTLPFSLLFSEAVLLSARCYFERVGMLREAACDPLTGLASWRGIDTYLHQRIGLARLRRASLALLFIDADGLKQINDRFGHGAGDELLRLVGEVCRLHTRERDLVGRRGGDEFLVVLDETDRKQAEKMAARLQRAVEDAVAVHPQFAQTRAGISVGLALYPQDAQEAQALIETADRQMYRNKQDRKARLSPV